MEPKHACLLPNVSTCRSCSRVLRDPSACPPRRRWTSSTMRAWAAWPPRRPGASGPAPGTAGQRPGSSGPRAEVRRCRRRTACASSTSGWPTSRMTARTSAACIADRHHHRQVAEHRRVAGQRLELRRQLRHPLQRRELQLEGEHTPRQREVLGHQRVDLAHPPEHRLPHPRLGRRARMERGHPGRAGRSARRPRAPRRWPPPRPARRRSRQPPPSTSSRAGRAAPRARRATWSRSSATGRRSFPSRGVAQVGPANLVEPERSAGW